MFKSLFRFLGRGISISILSAAIVITFCIVLLLMAVALTGEGPVIKAVACELGFSPNCLRQELKQERKRIGNLERQALLKQKEVRKLAEEVEAERQKTERLKRQAQALENRKAELERLYNRLATLDHASSSYVVFYDAQLGSRKVSTGHTYASLLDPETLVRAHCYFYGSVSGAGSRQITLGGMSKAKRVTYERYSDSELRDAGFSRSEIEKLRTKCRWPDGARE